MYLIIFIIGLVFGSFYNVVALRSLTKEKISLPPSRCTSCNHKLSSLDLVPVFSWFFLRGKCRYCKEPISYIYPLGELLTGISYVTIVYFFGFTIEALIQAVFISVMIIATTSDLKEMLVEDHFGLIGIALVLSLRIASPTPAIPYLISSISIFALWAIIFYASGGKVGGADVKLYALVGLSIGFLPTIASILYSSIATLSLIGPFIMLGKWDRKKPIPFVPFMTVGVLAFYVLGMGLFQP